MEPFSSLWHHCHFSGQRFRSSGLLWNNPLASRRRCPYLPAYAHLLLSLEPSLVLGQILILTDTGVSHIWPILMSSHARGASGSSSPTPWLCGCFHHRHHHAIRSSFTQTQNIQTGEETCLCHKGSRSPVQTATVTSYNLHHCLMLQSLPIAHWA